MQLPASQVERHPGADCRAQDNPHQTAEQKAHQAAAMSGEFNAANFLALMNDRHADGFFQKGLGQLHFEGCQQSGFRSLPARQQLAS
ncbi:hypothetical protein D3C85_1035540 [compost metagenome]